jgi:hypothetical protein
VEDLYEWKKRKDERLLRTMMREKDMEKQKGYSFKPFISQKSRKMAS